MPNHQHGGAGPIAPHQPAAQAFHPGCVAPHNHGGPGAAQDPPPPRGNPAQPPPPAPPALHPGGAPPALPGPPRAASLRSPRCAGGPALGARGLSRALSRALGWPAGAAALVIGPCGWGYNLGLKATAASWLAYAVAFGMLPAVATLSASPPRWPAVWAMGAGALLGVAAHLANVLPDLFDDAATGVRGFPHRIGARATALAGAGTLLAASAVILFGPGGHPGPWQWSGFLAALLVASIAAASAYRDPSSRLFFHAAIAIAALDLILFALSGALL